MLALSITCPTCNAALKLKSAPPAGVTVAKCPKCGKPIPLTPPSADPTDHTSAAPPAPVQDTASSVAGSGSRNEPTADNGTVAAPSGSPASDEFPFLAPAQQPDELGRLGSYRVLGVLGAGGMGAVFRAEDPALRRQIALKVMLPQFAANPTAKARFLREARAQAAVEHDHVITIHQVAEDRSVPFIAMPLLKGQPLSESLKANPAVPVPEAIRIAREMASGLAAAHELNLVHRDIKPANIWLEGSSRRVKILDFGLARAEADGDGTDAVTQQGAIVGTPAYMSPEQAQGDTLDARTDLFSLGIVLYQMLAGKQPFAGKNTPSILMAVVSHTPTRPVELNVQVPAELDALAMQLLAKSPADRPASAKAVVEALRAIEAGMNRTAEIPVVYAPAAVPDPWESIAATDPDTELTASEPDESEEVEAAPVRAPRKRRPWVLVATLLAFGALAAVAADIIIKIKNKDGTETEIKVPDGTTVTVTKDGKELGKFGPQPAKKDPPVAPPTAGPKDDPIDFAAERKAAEKLLKAENGYLNLIDAKGEPFGATLAQWREKKLPTTPFHIETVQISEGATDEMIASLAGCTRLGKLAVAGGPTNFVSDAGFKALKGFPRLWSFLLSAPIGDEGIAFLRGCPALYELTLSGTKVTDAGFAAFGGTPNLRKFQPPRAATDIGLAAVVRSCPELRDVNVDGVPVALTPLGKLPRLRVVFCHGTQFTEEGAATLAALPYLDQLLIESPDQGAISRISQFGSKLRVLRVKFPGVGVDLGPVFALPALDELHLDGVTIDARFLERLAGKSTIRRLYLRTDGAHLKYASDDITTFRRKRPDVELRLSDGKGSDWTTSPLANWPGKGEGDGGIAPWNLPKDAPPPAIVPFTADEAKKHQEAWAAHLKMPVEVESKATGMKFRLIPPGEVVYAQDGKNTLVRIAAPYYIGATEVTVGQFKKFVEATNYKTSQERSGAEFRWNNTGYPLAGDLPVTGLKWEDCLAFCAWLSKEDGATVRLPMEPEWEHAAYGGGARPKGFVGTEDAQLFGWVKDTTAGKPTPVQPVGGKRANPFGLHDVLGNVFEYCLASGERSGPVVRGAAWNQDDELTSRFPGEYAQSNTGFRVLRQTTNEQLPNPSKLSDKPILVTRGQPLSPQATVSRPAAVPGVRSWSVELAGHNGSVRSVAWSPKGDLIATGGEHDTSVRLWDKDGNLKQVLLGHEGNVSGVSFSADGTLLASCERVGGEYHSMLRVWDVATGACRLALPLRGWGLAVAFSPSGKEVAVCGTQRLCHIVTLDTGAVRVFPTDGDTEALAWSPNGAALVVWTSGKLTVWDATNAKPLGELPVPDWPDGKPRQVYSVGWSPDGKWLAAGSRDGRVRLWDAETRKHVRTMTMESRAVFAISWHQDSRLLAVYPDGKPIQIVDILDAKVVVTGPADPPTGYFAWSPDGKELVTKHEQGVLQFLDAATGKSLRQSPNRGWGLASSQFPPDGRRVIWKEWWGDKHREFDAETGELLREPKAPGGHLVALAPDSSWHCYHHGNVVSVVHADGKKFDLDIGGASFGWRTNPTGKRLAGSFGKQVIVWDTDTGKRLFTLDHPAGLDISGWSYGGSRDVVWSPDGKRIATAAVDKVIRLWEATDGKLLRAFDKFPPIPPGPPSTWMSLAWNPDNRGLWVTNDTHAAQLDTATGRYSAPESYSNGGAIGSLALAADGDSLLAREGYGWTFLRDRDGNRRLLGLYLGRCPQWHPDARRFLGVEGSFGVRGFDTRRNHRLGTLWPGLTGDHWICIGPDGHWRGSAGVESQIVVVAMLDDGSQRTYTPAEFEKQFGWKNDPAKARLLKLDP